MTAALMMATMMAGCSQDEGNYDYHSLNEPTITGVPETISVLTHANIDLDPNLGDNITDLDAYNYEWKVINKSGDNEVTVLGNEKHLVQEMTLPAGEYTLYFTATEKKTGLFWQQSYTLTVSDTSSEGWMVLCDVNSKTRRDMISKVTGKTYLDILKTSGMPELNHPYSIQYAPNSGHSDSPFYLFTADGATRLSNNSFVWQKDYDFKYEVATQTNLKPEHGMRPERHDENDCERRLCIFGIQHGYPGTLRCRQQAACSCTSCRSQHRSILLRIHLSAL